MEARAANFTRRRGRGRLLSLLFPFLKTAAALLRGAPPQGRPETLLVFQAYQVGDLYMALPALRLLSRHKRIVVACRPDCEGLLRRAGLEAMPFPHPFFLNQTPGAFLSGLRAARALRGRIGEALDLNADPRTALMLAGAGARPCVTYARPFGWFFDETFPIQPGTAHQSDKDLAVAVAYLARRGIVLAPEAVAAAGAVSGADASLLLSCWTRKDEKNWPLEYWDKVLERLIAKGRVFAILDAPDGDEAFAAFRERWRGKAQFLSTGLEAIEDSVRRSAGVVATDNFLGHMAAWHGKPVFWINGSSDPAHVAPRGPGTRIVQYDPMPCRPCGHRCVNPRYKCCLLDLRPERVLADLEDWLDGKVSRTPA